MKPDFTLRSPETGTDYKLFVEAPDAAKEPGPWPAVAFMDGDNQFEAAIEAYRQARPQVPPLLLVGVGYGASYGKPGNKRLRDYTATQVKTEPESGGADKFHSFLTTTLWPELAQRYPVDLRVRGLAGHSLGSLLVLHGLFRPRPVFTHFLASAPSIWWDDRSILGDIERLRQQRNTLPGRLYLSVGAKDSESMTGDLELLDTLLQKEPFAGLTVKTERFEDKDHYNVLTDAFRCGLTELFKN